MNNEGRNFLLDTLCKNLQTGSIELPDGPNGAPKKVSFSALGIGYPVIVSDARIDPNGIEFIPFPGDAVATAGRGPIMLRTSDRVGTDAEAPPEVWRLRRYDFVLQFCWKPTPRSEREQNSKKTEAAATTAMREQP